jgi:hypothetical protein
MLIGTLRTYGPHFAKGCADDEKLSDVLHKLDEPSLSALVEDHEAGTLEAGVRRVNASLNRLRRSEGEKEPVRYLAGLERRGALSLQRGASREPRKLASLRSDSAPSAASSAIIRTSEHFHVFSPPHA